jgi:hypothetical protein
VNSAGLLFEAMAAWAALDGEAVEGAFLPVVAPTSIAVDHMNEYYASHEEYLAVVSTRSTRSTRSSPTPG